ncbi:MAG: hypothetical protein KDJ90_06675 [Nitratireductor sp.]|nr:hypothetical protein [Nitratireductor sp.]
MAVLRKPLATPRRRPALTIADQVRDHWLAEKAIQTRFGTRGLERDVDLINRRLRDLCGVRR